MYLILVLCRFVMQKRKRKRSEPNLGELDAEVYHKKVTLINNRPQPVFQNAITWEIFNASVILTFWKLLPSFATSLYNRSGCWFWRAHGLYWKPGITVVI